jgi:hypothetical protein
MRLTLRIIGTWLFALAVILLIIDGTKSLAVDRVVLTSLAESWQGFSPQSFEAARQFLATRFFGAVLLPAFEGLVALPGFAVLGVPGLLLAFAGRSRRTRRFVSTDMV